MIQYNSNISTIVRPHKERLMDLAQNPDAMLRTVALAVLPEVRKRVHVEGKASDGSQIGTYSEGYLKLRTGNYGNSARKTKGKDKGGLKDAGTYSKGSKAGTLRPKYNRTADPKVILSLTRQMENDLSVLPSGTGYGIGYNNPDNYQKSQWNEATYKKKIWNLTDEEKTLAKTVAENFVQDFLNQSE